MPNSHKSVPVAVVDANVLFPLSLRDVFLRTVEKGLYRLRISRQIWDEVIRHNPPMTVGEVLNTLAQHVPTFVSRVSTKADGR